MDTNHTERGGMRIFPPESNLIMPDLSNLGELMKTKRLKKLSYYPDKHLIIEIRPAQKGKE